MYVTGKAMDHNYKHAAAKIGFMVDRVSGDDLANFPIEEARSRGCAYLLVLSFGVMLGYGWSIERHGPRRHPSHPAVLAGLPSNLVSSVLQRVARGCVSRDAEHGGHCGEHHAVCAIRDGGGGVTAARRCYGTRVGFQPFGAAERGWRVGCADGFEGRGHGIEEAKEGDRCIFFQQAWPPLI
jgi:hypothetical protein